MQEGVMKQKRIFLQISNDTPPALNAVTGFLKFKARE
jgi:hypothetical protein